MKAIAVIFTLAFVAVASAAPAVSATECPLTELAVSLPITALTACQSATNYTLVPPRALPTTKQAKAICTKCPDLIAAVETIKLPSCTLALADGTSVAIDTLFAKISSQCDKTPATTAPSTSGSVSGASEASASFDTPVPASTATTVTGSSLGPIDILHSTTTKPTTTAPRVLPLPSIGVRSVALGGGCAAFAFACGIAALAV